MKPRRALILVDLQNDFVSGGTLPVPHGDEVIAVANRVQRAFDLVVATQDWHPRDHGSFASNHRGKTPGDVINLNGLRQILWPIHCVQNTPGAEFHPGLDVSRVKKIVRKGTDPWLDSYSAFFDNGHRKATSLARYLKSHGVSDVYIMGLATDYCVKASALDARQLGFNVHVIEDGCRGVNLKVDDSEAAMEQMRLAGAQITRSSRILSTLKPAGKSTGKSAGKSLGKSAGVRSALRRAKRKVAILRKPARKLRRKITA